MGRPINTEARKIILRVIKFCEDEKKYGLLAPREHAIKRACLATGLCEADILEIKKEAQDVSGDAEDRGGMSQDDVKDTLEGVTNERCRNETPLTYSQPGDIATVLVKLEPLEEITDEVAAKHTTESDPGYLVHIKTEPVHEDEKVFDMSEDITQKNAQYCKNYRQRKKSANQAVVKKKTNSEYCRMYRQRKKLLAQQLQSENEVLHTPSTSSLQMTFESHQPITTAVAMAVDVKCEFTSDSEGDVPLKKIRLDPQCEDSQEDTQEPEIVNVKCEIQDGDPLNMSAEKCEQGGAAKSGTKPEPERNQGEKPNNKTNQSPRNPKHNEARFQCDVCKTSFRQMVILQRHVITHTGEKPYECDICHSRFSQNINLQRHRKTHTGEKPYECNVCHSRFSQNINLKRHLKTHTGEKPFECNICHSRFSQKVHLQQHVKIHGGEKQYECDMCKRWFAYKTSLQRHYRTHFTHESE